MAERTGLDILKGQIARGEIGSLYLFHGVEVHLRDHYVAMIREKLLPGGLDGFNFEALEGKGLTPVALSDAVSSVPVLGARRLVLVRDLDLYKTPADSRAGWEALLSSLPEHVCLIFVYDLLPFKPDARTRLQAALTENGLIVEFSLQETAALVTWLVRRFAALGKVIDRDTCEYLLFRCGRLMTALKGEVEKTAAYARGERVGREEIDAVVVPVLEAVVFDLTDAVADRRMGEAARILQKLQWMREPPEVLLGALSKTLRGLFVARLALNQHKGAAQVAQAMGYRSLYPARKLMAAAQKRSLDWCGRALLVCREADDALKGGGRYRERVMEWALAKLA